MTLTLTVLTSQPLPNV